MRTLAGSIRGPWVVACLVASLALPVEVMAAGGRGGGRGGRAPRMAAPRRPSAAPRPQPQRMPHPTNRATPRPNVAKNRPNVNNNRPNPATQSRMSPAARPNNARAGSNLAKPKTTPTPKPQTSKAAVAAAGAIGATAAVAGRGLAGGSVGRNASFSANRPQSYAYGTGTHARRYTANGYGHGYRNRTSHGGYGRSQSSNRSLVARLRSVHSSLARIDHDYQGHRVQAMRSISSAVRALSHRSGRAGATNRTVALNGNANGNLRNRAGRNGAQRMPQAQSDARMSQALRTTQGIHLQMGNQLSSSRAIGTARTHLTRSIREMQTALAVR